MYRHTVAEIRRTIVVVCLIAMQSSLAEPGDELIISSEIVNLRSAPSTQAEVPIKLTKNKKVIEIQRQGDWVEVETNRQDVKTGWLYKTLVKKGPKKETQAEKRYRVFQERYADYNAAIKEQNGTHYFTETAYSDETTLSVVPTAAWLNAEIEERQNTLSEVFKIWSDVVPVGISITLLVVDKQGKQHMLMLR